MIRIGWGKVGNLTGYNDGRWRWREGEGWMAVDKPSLLLDNGHDVVVVLSFSCMKTADRLGWKKLRTRPINQEL